MDWLTILQLAFSGLTIGCVYSLVGLGFALTLRATELINFAQGEMVMLGAFIGLSLITSFHLPYVIVFFLSLILTGLFGVFMEHFILRRILDNKSPLLNLLIATLGISIALQALAIVIWGREPVPYPEIFSGQTLYFAGIRLQYLNLWILCLGLASMAAPAVFFQKDHDRHLLARSQPRSCNCGVVWREPQAQRLIDVRLECGSGRRCWRPDCTLVFCLLRTGPLGPGKIVCCSGHGWIWRRRHHGRRAGVGGHRNPCCRPGFIRV